MDTPTSKKIESYATQLKAEGWCLVEGVIPDDRVEDLRDHVMEGHAKALQYYESIGGSLGFQTGPNQYPGGGGLVSEIYNIAYAKAMLQAALSA